MRRHTLRGHRRADHGRHLSLPRLPVFQRRRAGPRAAVPGGIGHAAARRRSTATAAVRAAPSCAASARTVARRYSAAPRAPTTTWSAPARWTTGSLPRAGQPVDRLGAVLAPHRCRRAQFSRQCATDSLRPTRYAAAKQQKGESCRTRPFLHATSGLPWRAVHLCITYCTTCASLPEAYWAAISVSGRALILLALPAVPNSV